MIYLFQDYSLDVERRELRRRMDLVRVEPQVLVLLQYLIRNRDHVVSKDELIAAVWNGRIISESALSSRITAVRHAIGDSGEQQRLIRTVVRKGFRFRFPVILNHRHLCRVVAGLVPATSILLALCSNARGRRDNPATTAGCDSKRPESAVGSIAQPKTHATGPRGHWSFGSFSTLRQVASRYPARSAP